MLKAVIIGNLGGDAEQKYSAQGTPFARFNVAANRRVRNQDGEWEDKTEWVRVTLTGTRSEKLAQYLAKGTKVYVEGGLEARPWTDNKGVLRAGLELLANEIELMSRGGDDSGAPAQPSQKPTRRPVPDDELPF